MEESIIIDSFELNEELLKGLEFHVLIVLFLLTYILSIAIQIRENNVKFKVADYFISFLSSLTGATIAFFATSVLDNIGFRIGFTILASLISYRIIRFIVSKEGQEEFLRIFRKRIGNKTENK